MDQTTARSLMKRAIEVAQLSKGEDDRLHPKVGALLADQAGNVLMHAFRGEDGAGGHAEYFLLEKAKNEGVDLSDKVLFVTLEPCSRRSPGKLPCAVRVARSGIRTVYIGTLDPNPQIIGRGVNFLVANNVAVEHFPADLQKELNDLNIAFQGQHAYLVDPIVSQRDDVVASRQRTGILATTLEIIAAAKSEVRIFSGDASWLRELFVGLLEAKLNGATIRMLAQKPLGAEVYSRLAAIGIEICDATQDLHIRGTMVMSDDGARQLIVVEPEPARHAQLFSAPHDGAVLRAFANAFNDAWDIGRARPATTPDLIELEVDAIAVALRREVRQYRSANISIKQIEIDGLRYLTNDVEILKLRRAASTSRIMAKRGLKAPLSIAGTPWAFFPPIVERHPDGKLTLIDGIHRVYDAIQHGRAVLDAILIDGVAADLPATPMDSFCANILSGKRERSARYANYDSTAFRPIRQALEAVAEQAAK